MVVFGSKRGCARKAVEESWFGKSKKMVWIGNLWQMRWSQECVRAVRGENKMTMLRPKRSCAQRTESGKRAFFLL